MKTDNEILTPWVERVLELSQRACEVAKKSLWAEHQGLRACERIPVTVYYEGIPFTQWNLVFGEGFLRCEGDLARRIELDLRLRVWMAENVCDDHIVWPSIVINMPAIERQGWGVDLKWKDSADVLGAKAYDPPFRDGIDIGRLTLPHYEYDPKAVADTLSEAEELTSGMLRVFPGYDNLGFAPFDTATSMRGMEDLLVDVALEPEKVTGLMEFITSAMEAHEKRREASGWLNIFPDSTGKYQQVGFRVHCAYLADDFQYRKPRLSDEWAYISEQTSAGLGPRDFDRFITPYNIRLAKMFTDNTVYYHGCERLDEKMDSLAQLPGLRRFHVSPWTGLEKACDTFQGRVVLEVHDHPGKVFFGSTPEESRQRIRNLIKTASGHPIDLNLSDIHSVNGNFDLLKQWAQIAREEVER